ncbi:MAG: hypothetical protein LBV64_06365, partial [Mediterranea sp.]|nr:hypothetical protein [Mediterranea sp.]
MESQVRIGGEQALSQLWEKSRLFVTDEFLQPPVILRVEDSIIGTLGNFSASTGKAKSKKTFNVCAIVAAALRNSLILNYSASLPQDKRRILYADTEQSKFHCQRVLRRILQLLGLLTGSQSDTSEFLPLRRPDELFPCAEYTGQYAYPLYCVCEELSLDLWLENPTQIKYRLGFQRGKNDRLDAKKIAAYACKFVEKARLLRLPEKALETLK